MNYQTINEAIKLYITTKDKLPAKDPDILLKHYGQTDGHTLIEEIDKLLHEIYALAEAIEASSSLSRDSDLKTIIDRAGSEMKQKHPELSTESINKLEDKISYSFWHG